MDEAENTDISDFQPFEEIHIVDLETKEEKTGSIGCSGLVERYGFDDLDMVGVLSKVGNNRCFSHYVLKAGIFRPFLFHIIYLE